MKNKKILKLSISIIVLSMLLSLGLLYKLRLDKPVFIPAYSEIGIEDTDKNNTSLGINLNIKYISNRDDKRNIVKMDIDELSETGLKIEENNKDFDEINCHENYIDDYCNYSVHSVNFSCSNLKFEEGKDVASLSKATVVFNDGTKQKVDLGKIILYKGNYRTVGVDRIDSSTRENGIEYNFYVDENVKIDKVESYLIDKVPDIFDYKIQVSPLDNAVYENYSKGTVINKKSIIKLSVNKKESDDIIEEYTTYNINPKIHFVNDLNDKYSVSCNGDMYSNYSFLGICKYLNARGEI